MMTSPVTWFNVASCMTTYDNVTVPASSERLRHFAQYKLFIDVYVISTLCVIGFVGNALSIVVLCSNRHERRSTTTCLLQTLAVVDTAYLLTCLIIQPIKVRRTWLLFSVQQNNRSSDLDYAAVVLRSLLKKSLALNDGCDYEHIYTYVTHCKWVW